MREGTRDKKHMDLKRQDGPDVEQDDERAGGGGETRKSDAPAPKRRWLNNQKMSGDAGEWQRGTYVASQKHPGIITFVIKWGAIKLKDEKNHTLEHGILWFVKWGAKSAGTVDHETKVFQKRKNNRTARFKRKRSK